MATRTVYTYTCPRCRTDLGRQFGLLTSKRIDCPGCGTNVRIDTIVIQENWGYNFAWVGGLLIWGGLAAGALLNPQFAATLGNGTLPAATPGNRLVIAAFSCIPALIGGLLIGGFGMLLGTIVAFGADEETPAQNTAPPSQLPSYPTGNARQTALQASQPPQPGKRSLLVRGAFMLLWPAVFFFGAALVLGMVTRSTQAKVETPPPIAAANTVALLASPHGQAPLLTVAANVSDQAKEEHLKQQAVEKRAEKSAPWLLLGALVVFVLGCLGWMPSTRSLKPTLASGGFHNSTDILGIDAVEQVRPDEIARRQRAGAEAAQRFRAHVLRALLADRVFSSRPRLHDGSAGGRLFGARRSRTEADRPAIGPEKCRVDVADDAGALLPGLRGTVAVDGTGHTAAPVNGDA